MSDTTEKAKEKAKKNAAGSSDPAASLHYQTILQEESLPQGAMPAAEKDCYLDRDLSWLEFDLRVLREAKDPRVPLLERLNFLNIYYSNLEEFFMVRVGSLTYRSLLLPDAKDDKTGWNAATTLKKILHTVEKQQLEAAETYKTLVEDLKNQGIDVLNFRHISKVDDAIAHKLFAEIRPQLSHRIIDSRHAMPYLNNQEDCVGLLVKKGDETLLGLIPISHLPKWKIFDVNGRQKVAFTGDLVAHFSQQLFKKAEIRETCVFRVTRNADVFIEDDLRSMNADFRASVEKMLRKRKRQQPVRMYIQGKPSPKLVTLLEKSLKIPEHSTVVSNVPMALNFGKGLKAAPGLKYGERKPERTVLLHKGELFSYIEKQDLLLSFPYQSISPFVELLYEAADDPDVESIKITLYRLASSSKIAAALAYASDRGKDVSCCLELRARFDEQNNIDYSELLEAAGCTVYYGLPDQKIHSKLCLITRRKGDQVLYITQVGTGNYNEVTSELYCDLSLITADQQIGKDASQIFDALSKGEVPEEGEKLWIAPNDYRQRVLALLDREKAKGKEGFAALKVNGLNDLEIMHKMVECSQAGVRIELYIRGICCLCPEIPDFTDHITVRSVVGRYLEHSRVFVFGRGEDQRIFMGSGDFLNRNTRRRVEVFIEAQDPAIKKQLLEVIDAYRCDVEKGWHMLSDGTYVKDGSGDHTASQERLYRYFSKQIVGQEPPKANENVKAPDFRSEVNDIRPEAKEVLPESKEAQPEAAVSKEKICPEAPRKKATFLERLKFLIYGEK